MKVKVCVLFIGERRALHHPDDESLDLERHSDVFKLLDREVADVGVHSCPIIRSSGSTMDGDGGGGTGWTKKTRGSLDSAC